MGIAQGHVDRQFASEARRRRIRQYLEHVLRGHATIGMRHDHRPLGPMAVALEHRVDDLNVGGRQPPRVPRRDVAGRIHEAHVAEEILRDLVGHRRDEIDGLVRAVRFGVRGPPLVAPVGVGVLVDDLAAEGHEIESLATGDAIEVVDGHHRVPGGAMETEVKVVVARIPTLARPVHHARQRGLDHGLPALLHRHGLAERAPLETAHGLDGVRAGRQGQVDGIPEGVETAAPVAVRDGRFRDDRVAGFARDSEPRHALGHVYGEAPFRGLDRKRRPLETHVVDPPLAGVDLAVPEPAEAVGVVERRFASDDAEPDLKAARWRRRDHVSPALDPVRGLAASDRHERLIVLRVASDRSPRLVKEHERHPVDAAGVRPMADAVALDGATEGVLRARRDWNGSAVPRCPAASGRQPQAAAAVHAAVGLPVRRLPQRARRQMPVLRDRAGTLLERAVGHRLRRRCEGQVKRPGLVEVLNPGRLAVHRRRPWRTPERGNLGAQAFMLGV